MRLAHTANDLKAVGVKTQGNFKINATGKAFRALIDGLYSNKIQSIVRELAANAFDSHRELGTDKPFHIQGPTEFKKEFSIRDYGVGMSHHKVMSLYSTLFASDKDKTNDLVGAFGLGSKSPFAYTNSFCISCYDGTNARHYTAAIGDDDVPQITLLAAESCSEPLGVRVSFAVKEADFDEFNNAIRTIYIAHAPAFETNVESKGSLGTVTIQGTGWAGYTNSALNHGWSVRQGCVIYPVDTQQINVPTDYSSTRWLIEAPIGSIEVTTSREAISYTPDVVAYLNQRFKEIAEEGYKIVKAEADKIENVSKFFTFINTRKPHWVTEEFIHCETGLKSPTLLLEGLGAVFHCEFTARSGLWTTAKYDLLTAIKATHPAFNVYDIRDISRLLDKDRPADFKTNFTEREERRIRRLLRNYCESHDLTHAVFYLAVDKTDRFFELFSPSLIRTPLTVEALQNIVPRSPEEKKATPKFIRGVTLKTGTASPVDVEQIVPAGNAAWITAKQAQRGLNNLHTLAMHFGFTNLYIGSSYAYETMEESGVPLLQQAIADRLLKQKTSWDEFSSLVNLLDNYSYYENFLEKMINFARNAFEKAPEAYKKLHQSKNVAGQAITILRPYIENKILPFGREFKDAVRLLNEGYRGQRLDVQMTPSVTKLKTLKSKYFTASEASPAIRFMDDMQHAKTPRQMLVTVNSLIALFKAMPPKMLWSEL